MLQVLVVLVYQLQLAVEQQQVLVN